jgi:hypothetical protein
MPVNSVLDDESDRAGSFRGCDRRRDPVSVALIKGRSISKNEAWISVVTGLTLDIAFANGETEYADRTLGSSLLDPTSY